MTTYTRPKLFKHRETVRLVGMGTPSQRHTLWEIRFRVEKDYGDDPVHICRVEDDTCSIWVPRRYVVSASLLDLLVAE
ncbi:MAG: hypothetical protein AB7L09_03395 [Nitrospira sp.]